jgi:hypothetical protein
MNIDGMAITYYLDEIESIDGKVLAIPKIEEKTINTTETTRIQLPPIEIIEVEYKLSPEVKDYIKAEIIMLWQFYRNQFDFEYPQDSAIKVRIFGNLDTFEEHQISLRGKVLSRAGVFWHKTKEVAVWKNKNQGTMIDMIIHEVSHFLLYLQYNKFPKWISEGLSVFFEGMRISKDNIEIGWFREEDAWCKHKVKYEKDFDIRNYFNMSGKEWDIVNETSGYRAYDVAGFIIRFFMTTASRRDILKNIINYIKDNPDTWQGSVYAINFYYPGGFQQFDKDWRTWVIEPRENIYLSIK